MSINLPWIVSGSPNDVAIPSHFRHSTAHKCGPCKYPLHNLGTRYLTQEELSVLFWVCKYCTHCHLSHVPRTRWARHSKLIFWTRPFVSIVVETITEGKTPESSSVCFFLRCKTVQKEYFQFTWDTLTEQMLQPQEDSHRKKSTIIPPKNLAVDITIP